MKAEQTRRNVYAETGLSHKNLQMLEFRAAHVDMRWIHAGKRQLEPGGDSDMVCEMDVCDELNDFLSDVYANDCEGDYTDGM